MALWSWKRDDNNNNAKATVACVLCFLHPTKRKSHKEKQVFNGNYANYFHFLTPSLNFWEVVGVLLFFWNFPKKLFHNQNYALRTMECKLFVAWINWWSRKDIFDKETKQRRPKKVMTWKLAVMTHSARLFSLPFYALTFASPTSTQKQSEDFIKPHSGEINAFHFKSFSRFFFLCAVVKQMMPIEKKENLQICPFIPPFLTHWRSIEKEANTQKTRFVEHWKAYILQFHRKKIGNETSTLNRRGFNLATFPDTQKYTEKILEKRRKANTNGPET